MYTEQKNNKKLKVWSYIEFQVQNEKILIFQALYEQSLHIKSAIPHPLIMGVIRGKNYYIVLQ